MSLIWQCNIYDRSIVVHETERGMLLREERLTKSGLSAGKFVAFKASGRAKVSINVAVDVDLKE